jgi:hypothetical protein
MKPDGHPFKVPQVEPIPFFGEAPIAVVRGTTEGTIERMEGS